MKNFAKIFLLCFIVAAGIFLFQAQAVDNNGNDLTDRNPVLDPGHFKVPPPNNTLDVITDASGFDNFDIGANGSEMNLTQNHNNPFQFFFGVNGSPVNQYFSNNGLDWTQTQTISLPGGTCCDPWAAYDSSGNLYYSVLGSGNFVAKSTNNGQTFGAFSLAVSGGDRNTIAADYTNGPYKGYIYAAAWSPNANFSRSTNGGTSWQTTLSGTPNTTPGNMICIGPSPDLQTQGGSVYLVTITGSNPAPSTFNFFRSTNGGLNMVQTGAAAISPGYVGTLNSASRLVINNARTRPYPMIACDNSYGPYRGRLYCVYASNVPAGNGNKPDILCQYSTDGGATWSSPTTVNDNANPSASDQWYPAVWCDKVSGKLYVKWYDTRNNPASYGVDVYASYTTNGGQSFVANQRLTTATWTYPCPACGANQNCYRGDYDAISAYKFSSLAMWSDMRNCNYTNMAAYFPDFAMKVTPGSFGLNNVNDSAFSFVSIPAVKLYTDKVKFTSTVTPAPGTGSITVSFLNRSNGSAMDSLTTYPDSLRVRIKTSGGVTSGAYTINIFGKGRIAGEDGPPIHKRTITVNVNPVGIVTLGNEVPEKFYLYQNYPNPFNPTTNIKFDISKGGMVKLAVYDIAGKQVAELVNANYNAGKYNFDFNASSFASGVYFYKLETPDYTNIRKMILVK